MRLNLNDNIKVKLTDLGKDIYYHQFDDLNTELGREICKPTYPKVDEDGYTTFQLWVFMELYGRHIWMTKPDVIEPLEIVFEPEIIRCNECKHSRDLYNDGDCYCCKPNEMAMWHGGRWDFYCADAEKMEDKS